MGADQQPAHHFLLVCFPTQSHINPALRFARMLTSLGVRVTFSTAVSAHRRMFPDHRPYPADKNDSSIAVTPHLDDLLDPLLSYQPYSDGFDDGRPMGLSGDEYMATIHAVGSKTLRSFATAHGRRPAFTCVVYTLSLPWATKVAREVGLPSALFWIQPASLFLVVHHYFHGHSATFCRIREKLEAPAHVGGGCNSDESSCGDPLSIALPGLPRLSASDLPCFLIGLGSKGCPPEEFGGDRRGWNGAILNELEQTCRILDEEMEASGKKPKVLLNTFKALEDEALAAVADAVEPVPIGFVLPQPVTVADSKAAMTNTADLIKHDNHAVYMEWLGRWPDKSVVYVSFGSSAVLGKAQVDEVAKALVGSDRPFLWVVRALGGQPDGDILEAAGEKAMVVGWCQQVEVLHHASVGCFVSHCGWNSTSETIAAGVPMVALPLWSDQPMNAGFIVGTWKVGVRAWADAQGIVRAPELQRCVEIIMGNGQEAAAIRTAAKELGEKALAAIEEGGSSDRNLKAFIEGVNSGS